VIRAIKSTAAFLFWSWPFGNIYKAPDGEGGTLRVTKSLWVITSDGKSTDALPLTFCSQALVDRVEESLKRRWWYMPPRADRAPDQGAAASEGDKP
jgi:hypothetical protein